MMLHADVPLLSTGKIHFYTKKYFMMVFFLGWWFSLLALVASILVTHASLLPNSVGCKYKNVTYNQGESWDDRCDYACTCQDAQSGQYQCDARCPQFPSTMPTNCKKITTPGECCGKIQCDIPSISPTPQSEVITTSAPKRSLGQFSVLGLLVIGNSQQVEDPVSSDSSGLSPAADKCADAKPLICSLHSDIICSNAAYASWAFVNCQKTCTKCSANDCVFKKTGKIYSHGKTWKDGCDKNCTCINGIYSCIELCPVYEDLPKNWSLAKTEDKCCPHPVFTPESVCVYKGKSYTQGQKWEDGCDNKCECINATLGRLICAHNKCPVYTDVPSTCRMVKNPRNPCCQIPKCYSLPPTQPPLQVKLTSQTGQTTSNTTPYIGPATQPLYTVTPNPYTDQSTGPSSNSPYESQPSTKTPRTTPTVTSNRFTDQPSRPTTNLPSVTQASVSTSRTTHTLTSNLYTNQSTRPTTNFPSVTQASNRTSRPMPTVISNPYTDQPTRPTNNPSSVTPRPTFRNTTSRVTYKPTNMCVYKGAVYAQGSTWEDGCDWSCKCEDAHNNFYQCQAKCKLFSELPAQCTMVQDPSEPCCKVPRCTAQPGNIALIPYFNTHNGSNVTPQPGKLNIVPVGQYSQLFGNNWQQLGTGSKVTRIGSFGNCLYKQAIFNVGITGPDYCDYVCTCQKAHSGQYQCVSKCPQLPSPLPSYCKRITIPGQCCAKIKCDIPGVSYRPPSEVLPTPGSLGLFTGEAGILVIGTPPSTPVFPGGGFSILPQQFSQVRSQCLFHQKATRTAAEKYLLFNEGETWKVGCEFNCKCMDGKSGYYYCDPMCPDYTSIPSSKCFLQKIEGQCCNQLRCLLENGQVVNPLKTQTQYTIIGSLSNGYIGFGPNYNYNSTENVGYPFTNSTNFSKVCKYKERFYYPGQIWSDGCDFDCKCENDQGAITCTPRCSTYTFLPLLPSFCQMKENGCCARLVCDRPQTTLVPPVTTTALPTRPTCAWCRDELNNCKEYGQEACQGQYKPWASRNCAHYCGLCLADCDHIPTTTTTEKPLCDCPGDKLDNCEDFGKDVCVGIFHQWALDNCNRYCAKIHTTNASCADTHPVICRRQSDIICTNAAYSSWASVNCQKTCGTCPGMTTPAPMGCLFNKTGMVYAHGETWKDGCDKNCTCTNGIYSCIDICPIYVDLPLNWSLVKYPGKCCAHPIIKSDARCHYKGKVYHQDEIWVDGCKYKCICHDAKNGQYECRKRCPVWRLSSYCGWVEPYPGKCCRQPTCYNLPYLLKGYPDE